MIKKAAAKPRRATSAKPPRAAGPTATRSVARSSATRVIAKSTASRAIARSTTSQTVAKSTATQAIAKSTASRAAAGTVVTRAVERKRSFAEVVALIESARQRALHSVNAELVGLYWRVGEYISRKLQTAEWGDGVVDELARHIARTQPGVVGFTRRNLFRMRQFYEAYQSNPIVTPLVTQLPWTHNLTILTQCHRPDEREFYLRTAIRERWGKRELERQLRGALFERTVLSPPRASSRVAQSHPEALDIFKDAYIVDFLNLPQTHAEADLHRGLIAQMKKFITELGRDFCFVGSEYPIQVGGRDFSLDLLFFHRGLNSLVAIELKVGRFEPEYLGKLEFYLEALDRDERKDHERPSIGVLMCASRDAEVVEYALSRSLSPALVAEYQTQLPDRKLLQGKLHELYQSSLAARKSRKPSSTDTARGKQLRRN